MEKGGKKGGEGVEVGGPLRGQELGSGSGAVCRGVGEGYGQRALLPYPCTNLPPRQALLVATKFYGLC